jgi:dephospho-CoA kinase
MLKIGLTGGIGSGKTLVSKIFATLQIPVFNSDKQASLVMLHNKGLKEDLIRQFGSSVYNHEGHLNKEYLRTLIFNNSQIRDKLNSLVHPVVREEFLLFCNVNAQSPYVLQEAAILFESNAYKLLDKVITVFAPQQIRIERIMQRDGIDEEMVQRIMKNQLSEEEKKERSDFVINNDGNGMLIDQVMDIHKKILKLKS